MSQKKGKVEIEAKAKLIEVKPLVYKFGWLGYILAKVLIQSSRWFADQVFGKFADWIELKLKK